LNTDPGDHHKEAKLKEPRRGGKKRGAEGCRLYGETGGKRGRKGSNAGNTKRKETG